MKITIRYTKYDKTSKIMTRRVELREEVDVQPGQTFFVGRYTFTIKEIDEEGVHIRSNDAMLTVAKSPTEEEDTRELYIGKEIVYCSITEGNIVYSMMMTII